MERVNKTFKYRYIKDYDGGTLMEAYVNPDINYSEISNIIKKQNDFLKKQILSRLNVCERYKFSDLEKILRKNQDENNSKIKISENLFNLIPGIKENNWEYTDYMNLINNSNSNLNFLSQCRNVINKLKMYKNSWPFHNPVDVKDVPDYYDVIKEPMGKD
jgi:histone acetyltransferase